MYRRHEAHGYVYYITDSVFDVFVANHDKRPSYCMMMSDFVVQLSTNELVKCRYPVEVMLDNWLGFSLINNTMPPPTDAGR